MGNERIDAPLNPAGEFVSEYHISDARRGELIAIIEQAPRALEQAVANVDRPAVTAYHAARTTSQAGVRGPRLAAARN